MATDSISNGSFAYDRLISTTTAIRTFQIKGRNARGQIECTLTNTSLEQVGKYNAVSYMWGDDEGDNKFRILLNGKQFRVRENLFHFLEVVCERPDLHKGPFWIDAICIDQHTPFERNHQVRLMSRIYSKAECVLIWLGAANPEHDVLTTMTTYESTGRSRCDRDCESLMKSLVAIVDNPYWQRMWVIQEIHLARNRRILFGLDSAEWETFWDGVRRFHKHMLRFDAIHPPGRMEDLSKLNNAAWYYYNHDTVRMELSSSSNAPNMEKLLFDYGDRECTDLRDRVIALLSLVKGGDTFCPDYSRSAAYLGISVWLHFQGTQSLFEMLVETLDLRLHQVHECLITFEFRATLSSWLSWRPKRYGHRTTLHCEYCNITIVEAAESDFDQKLPQSTYVCPSISDHRVQIGFLSQNWTRSLFDHDISVADDLDIENRLCIRNEEPEKDETQALDLLQTHIKVLHSDVANTAFSLRCTMAFWPVEELHSSWLNYLWMDYAWFAIVQFSVPWNDSLTKSLGENAALPNWLRDPMEVVPTHPGQEEPTYQIEQLSWPDLRIARPVVYSHQHARLGQFAHLAI